MSVTVATTAPSPGRLVGTEPRVQLLPPIVKQREKNRASQRLAVLLVILAIALSGAMFLWGMFQQGIAQSNLDAANQRTADLTAQQAEYREATDVATLVTDLEQLQLSVTSYEMLWGELLIDLQSYLPPGATIAGMDVINQPPWAQNMPIEDPLRTPRLTMIELTLTSTTIFDATDIDRAFRQLPGYADSVITTVAVGLDGTVVTQVSLTLANDALAHRFDETEDADEEAAADGAAAEDEVAEVEPDPAATAEPAEGENQ